MNFECNHCHGRGIVRVAKVKPHVFRFTYSPDDVPTQVNFDIGEEPCLVCSGTGLDLPCFHGRDAPWKPICGMRFIGKNVYYDPCDDPTQPSKVADRAAWFKGRYVVYRGVRTSQFMRDDPTRRRALDDEIEKRSKCV